MKNIKEYKTNLISDSDFEDWKSSWDGISEPPKQIIRYVSEVLIKRADATYDEWMALLPKKL